ncbi:MAG TPA: hypothetical protein VFZ66_27560 [Herpetosiphonaceae bacterium]
MTNPATDYESQNPRVTMPKAVYDRALLGALQLSRTEDQPITRRDLVETAIATYLEQAQQARAAGQPLTAERVAIRSGSPGVRISAALRAELAAEARQQSVEQASDIGVGHVATAAITSYLDARGIPFPASNPPSSP